MNSLKTALALIAGIVIGSVVNMGLVMAGPMLIASPAGVDMTTAEGIKAALPLLEARHFVSPYLAHAVGTLAGAIAGAVMAGTRRTFVAYAVGTLFLAGGIAASRMIPAPMWFVALDLVTAYLPMAWLGLNIANRVKPAV